MESVGPVSGKKDSGFFSNLFKTGKEEADDKNKEKDSGLTGTTFDVLRDNLIKNRRRLNNLKYPVEPGFRLMNIDNDVNVNLLKEYRGNKSNLKLSKDEERLMYQKIPDVKFNIQKKDYFHV